MQYQWINNALEVQKIQYANELKNSAHDIRRELEHKAASTFLGINPSKFDLPDVASSYYVVRKIGDLPSNEIIETISSQLKKNNIEMDFDYVIRNEFQRAPVSWSPREANKDRNSFDVKINLDINGIYVLYVQLYEPKNYLLKRTSWMITSSIIFSIFIIGAFAITLRTVLRQRKVGEIKSDFINNMTHEFKTPLATVSLAADALRTEKVQQDPEKIKYFTDIIKDENNRMNKQVQKILEAAKLERSNIELNLQPLHVHQYIEQAANNSEINIHSKNGQIHMHLYAKNDRIEGDEVHISNIIFNLIDNAVKYCETVPEINIYTHSNRNSLFIKIEDNGIGMDKETMKHVFEKFYRAHTGNVHNVKGFGLGLSYVKAVVEAHNGKIKVDSTLGKGSTFTIELPILKNN